MNATQLDFARRLFNKWVESTDVAEQCGLTREEMIDSAEFNTQEHRDWASKLARRHYAEFLRDNLPALGSQLGR